MPKYADTLTGEILEYPEEAAALFPNLKLVPSERAASKEKVAIELDKNKVVETNLTAKEDTTSKKNGETDAK